jgi:hypothetical protein
VQVNPQSPPTPQSIPTDRPTTTAGAGFLAPFHIGVAKALLDKGIITDRTKARDEASIDDPTIAL